MRDETDGKAAPMTGRALVVDDAVDVRRTVSRALRRMGLLVDQAESLEAARRSVNECPPEVVVLDHLLPDGTSLDLIPMLRDADASVIVLTGHGSIQLAVEAVKGGAEQFLTKPVQTASLVAAVERVLDTRRMRRLEAAERRRPSADRPNPFTGSSPAIRRLAAEASAVASADAPVLVTGETGTGKGVLAKWIHEQSARSRGAFVDLNCAGLSRELAESELFGHQKGSFTSATSNKQGLVEIANGGTLFLDEIGDLDLAVQPKLLKILEEGTYRAVGATRNRVTNIRLLAATHHDLPRMASEGRFRLDLLFRINTIVFSLPSLRSRPEDIPALAAAVLDEVRGRTGKRQLRTAPGVTEALCAYAWPGNIRELRNVLERAALLCRYDLIEPRHLQLAPALQGAAEPEPGDLTLAEVERRHIESMLKRHDGHVGRTAEALGVPRSSLYGRLRSLGLLAASTKGLS
jgi:DNA-binding NtrC family response regulator